ncbi:MAG TPA: dipeptide epimerase [Chloroflexi bacterium]|nr:dipeptide epimerase [Chloroflexota bacterium]
MRITTIEAIPIAIPLIRPLKMAVATVHHRDSVLVRVHTDEGLTGLGETVLAQYFTGETPAAAKHAIEEFLAPALAGMDAFDLHAIVQRMDRVLSGNSATKAAIDIALHDLVAKALDVPLYKLLGGQVRDRVYSTWHVVAAQPEQAAEEAREGLAQGFRAIKVKLGTQRLEVDLQRLRAVREAAGEDILLRPDANQAWTPAEAIRFLRAAEEYGLQFIEQPVKRTDMAGMAAVARAVDTAVAPDEGLFNAEDALHYIRAGAADGVVMKLIKTGGLVEAQRLASVVQAANLGLHLAGMPGETSICAAAEVHLAVTLPGLNWDSGIATHFAQRDVVAERLLPVEGAYFPPEKPGLGVELDDAALARCRTDR